MKEYKPPLEGRRTGNYLLLDFNERTNGPSIKIKEALRKFIDEGNLQIYPEYGDLEEKIAKYSDVEPNQIMVTNGADQGIDIICRAHLKENDLTIIPYPEFAMYYQSVKIQGAKILEPEYKEEGNLPLKEILKLINKEEVKLVIFSNPNNPTGITTPISKVEEILKEAKKKKIPVLHDEAYFEFSKITAKDLIKKYDNLYIVRTFAKAFGLVSARAGYIISQKENIQEFLKIRGPYDVNMFAKTAILAALEDTKYIKDYTKEIMEKSKPKLEKFLREKGISFYPSCANFLLLKIQNSEKVIEDLKSKGILVRLKKGPDKNTAPRVSIGNKAETDRLIDTLNKIM